MAEGEVLLVYNVSNVKVGALAPPLLVVLDDFSISSVLFSFLVIKMA